jgi:ribonuclease HI
MNKPTKGIVVDGACSGNPGPGEYRGINLETKEILFHQKFSMTTNNIMEFCGIVHAIKYSKEKKLDLHIYSDSVVALNWIDKKKTFSSLISNEKTAIMHTFIRNCEKWLLENTKNSIPTSKWITSEWGEIQRILEINNQK